MALVVVLGASGDGPLGRERTTSGRSATEEASPAAGVAADSAPRDSGAGVSGTGGADRAAPAPAPEAAGKQAAPPVATAVAPAPDAGAIAPARARKVERSAVLALRTPDQDFERTTDASSRPSAASTGSSPARRSAPATSPAARRRSSCGFPTERLDRALAALSKLGHVTERNQSLQDITASFTSAQERLTDARAERRGLLRALARATTQNQIA